MKKPQKQIELRLPIRVMEYVKRVAKMAGVSPTTVYNVMLAMGVTEFQKPVTRQSTATSK